jgi:uncharacterized protein (DUF433 family)
MKDFDRVTHDRAVMGGAACIRGMRVTVNMIVGEREAGRGIDQILADFPYLEREDIIQAERYVSFMESARETDLAAT